MRPTRRQLGAAKLLREVGLADELYQETFHHETVGGLAQALRDSLATAVPITHLGSCSSQAKHLSGIN